MVIGKRTATLNRGAALALVASLDSFVVNQWSVCLYPNFFSSSYRL